MLEQTVAIIGSVLKMAFTFEGIGVLILAWVFWSSRPEVRKRRERKRFGMSGIGLLFGTWSGPSFGDIFGSGGDGCDGGDGGGD